MTAYILPITLLVMLCQAKSAHAGYGLPEVRSFFAKKKPCAFSMVEVVKDPKVAYAGVACQDGPGDMFWTCMERTKFFCIFDTVIDRGTIKEKAGCGLGSYDFENNTYRLANDDSLNVFFVPKP